MPRVRLLTDQQEDAALARFLAANGARGTISKLAGEHHVTWPTMNTALKRAEQRVAFKVSRETLNSDDGNS